MAHLRIWHIIAAAFLFHLSTGSAWACETRTIEGMGTFDARAPIAASVPGYNATLDELRAAAQYERQTYIIDSHEQAHNLFLFFFHTEQSLWRIYAVMDASEVTNAEGEHLFFLTDQQLFFTPDGIWNGGGSYSWNIIWTSGESQYVDVDLSYFEQQSSDAVIAINGARFRACPQYGSLDVDADGNDDFVVWRPSSGMWAATKSAPYSDEYLWTQWGLPGDYPFVGDYTGDGSVDLVVWRPSNGTWYLCSYEDCQRYGYARQFGLPTDRPVKADFDHDGIFDFAVWRPSWGTYFYLGSATNNVGVIRWGLPGDIPVGVGSNR